MDLELITHIGVIAFLIIDAGSHIWRHRWWNRESKYTLDEAKAILWDIYVAQPRPILFDNKDATAKELSRTMDIWG